MRCSQSPEGSYNRYDCHEAPLLHLSSPGLALEASTHELDVPRGSVRRPELRVKQTRMAPDASWALVRDDSLDARSAGRWHLPPSRRPIK